MKPVEQTLLPLSMNYIAAANYMGLSPSRFLALVRRGEVPGRIPPGVKLSERGRIPLSVLFRRQDLDGYLENLPVFKP